MSQKSKAQIGSYELRIRLEAERQALNKAAEESFSNSTPICTLRVRELNKIVNEFSGDLPDLKQEWTLRQSRTKDEW